mgnify:CR=1 FL=1
MKKLKKLLSITLLALSVVSSSIPLQNVTGTNEVVQAATIRLNYSNLSISEGQSKTLKVIGTKSKVKWSSSKSSVASVTSKGKVTAKKEGSTTITAKVGKKKLKCSVVVKNFFSAKDAKKSITMNEKIVNGYLYVFSESDYKVPTDIDAKCTFYSSNGKVVDYSNDSISYLEKGHTGILKFRLPSVEYEHYDIEYEYDEGMKYYYHRSIIDFLSLSTNYVEDEYTPYLIATVENSANYECYYADIAVVFYDSYGNIIDVNTESTEVKANSSNSVKVYLPYDSETYEDIPYDHYDAFITYAYHLGK